MMTYRGIIENGRLVLDGGTRLPDGTEVDVQLRRRAATNRSRSAKSSRSPKKNGKAVDPAYRLSDLAVRTGIRDLAEQHDHYIYGTAKRSSRKRTKRKRA